MRAGLKGAPSGLLDLYALASMGQQVGREMWPALLFVHRLLGEPDSLWLGVAEILKGVTKDA